MYSCILFAVSLIPSIDLCIRQHASVHLSHAQSLSLIQHLIAGLQHTSLKPGDSACIHLFNSVTYPILVLAIIGAGGFFAGQTPRIHTTNSPIRSKSPKRTSSLQNRTSSCQSAKPLAPSKSPHPASSSLTHQTKLLRPLSSQSVTSQIPTPAPSPSVFF
jgi:hypothetical protein